MAASSKLFNMLKACTRLIAAHCSQVMTAGLGASFDAFGALLFGQASANHQQVAQIAHGNF